jgi:hypothetical protein
VSHDFADVFGEVFLIPAGFIVLESLGVGRTLVDLAIADPPGLSYVPPIGIFYMGETRFSVSRRV